MDLNKHIYNNNNSRVFHSNGYADVANKNSFGSDGNVSFSQRKIIEQNRHAVPVYGSSAIGNAYSKDRTRPVVNNANVNRGAKTLSRSQMQQLKNSNILSRSQMQQLQNSSQRGGNFIIPTRQFQEPAGRTYNPYQ